jgi:hypothetical protein
MKTAKVIRNTPMKINKELYIGGYLFFTISSMFLSYLGLRNISTQQLLGSLTMLASSGVSLVGVVFIVVFIYKIWKVIPKKIARTTPGKAAGYYFIPFYNLYWVFVIYWGWCKDYNLYTRKAEPRVPQMSESLGLALCVIPLVVFGINIVLQFLIPVSTKFGFSSILEIAIMGLQCLFMVKAGNAVNILSTVNLGLDFMELSVEERAIKSEESGWDDYDGTEEKVKPTKMTQSQTDDEELGKEKKSDAKDEW